ncbi:cysteine peptidase family C39 domain-containing protein, partial [Proteiniphilum sp. UBA5259]|uniref:cysteine peptidase family C39 domain-containing protein n=1 Tax=Proteiniphilum sp. UBA5259 TaxID=1947269 RepID=UPI0039C9012B
MMKKKFPYYTQLDAMDCGPSCLRMIAKHYGRHYSLETLRQHSFITREGVSMLGISDAAEHIGFRTSGVMISFEQLVKEAPLPCIVHWKQNHFVVVYNIKKDKRVGHRIYVADPALGLVTYDEADFKKCWYSTKKDEEEKGTALLLEPGPEFFDREDEKENRTRSLRYFLRYLTPYKSQLMQLVLG